MSIGFLLFFEKITSLLQTYKTAVCFFPTVFVSFFVDNVDNLVYNLVFIAF